MGQGLILKRPIISEKSLDAAANGNYSFEVEKKAKKKEIARAIKEVFGVDAKKVRTIIVKGKKRRAGKNRKEHRLSDWKKAIVKLAAGQKIDIFETSSQPSPKASAGKEEKK